MKPPILLFILVPLFLMSCVGQGVRLADGTTVVNHAALSYNADSEDASSDVTLPGGVHIVQHYGAVKPDGSQWTKYFTVYKLGSDTLKAGVRTNSDNKAASVANNKINHAEGVIGAKGKTAVDLQNAKNAAPLP